MEIQINQKVVDICQALWLEAGQSPAPPEEVCSHVIAAHFQAMREAGLVPTPAETTPDLDEDEDIAILAELDLDAIELLNREEIEKEAPKDRLAEICADDEAAWMALGIVYKAIARDMWGGPIAEKLFMQTLESVRRQL